jgi:hypothetical protein
MPPVALHCIVHLLPSDMQLARFPGVWYIRNSPVGSPTHYSLWDMFLWSTIPYAIWQLSYHFMITVRRREKIAAGRPTSFTWLRKSYSKVWIGRLVISLPQALQEPAFMLIQYSYALLTMTPCPLWFWYRYPSAVFLMAVFCWSIYNGATYYIDVFGNRFQKELESMKREVAKWQNSPDMLISPLLTPRTEGGGELGSTIDAQADKELARGNSSGESTYRKTRSVDNLPMLDKIGVAATGLDGGAKDVARERKIGEMPA